MRIVINNKEYNIPDRYIGPARQSIHNFLSRSSDAAKDLNDEKIYKATVVMMYVISSGILSNMSSKDINDLISKKLEEIR